MLKQKFALIVGRALLLDGDMLVTSSGGARNSFNMKWFRPVPDPICEVTRLAPDKRETCQNLLKMVQMAKFEKARMAYEKQYLAMAGRYLAGEVMQ